LSPLILRSTHAKNGLCPDRVQATDLLDLQPNTLSTSHPLLNDCCTMVP
jgi:hypothetical protein